MKINHKTITHEGQTFKVHPEDFRQDTYDKLLETLKTKTLVAFNGYKGQELGYISSENDSYIRVKFLVNLFGFLYCEDAWEATTAKACGREQIEILN